MSTAIGRFSDKLGKGISRLQALIGASLRSWRLGRLLTTMQGKLVLTSLLASVLPMLLVAEITSNIIVDRIHQNLETMLVEVSGYFLSSIKESQDETGSVINFLTAQAGWIDPSTYQIHVDPSVKKLFEGLGYDAIAIVGKDLNVISSYPQGLEIRSVAVSGVSNLYAIQYKGHLTMMSGAVRQAKVGGKSVSVFIGSWIDEDFMSAARSVNSIEIELYYLKDGAFHQVFSSRAPYVDHKLSPEVVDKLIKTRAPVLLQANGYGFGNVLFQGITTSNGQTIGILSMRLISPIANESWVDHKNIFIGIFVIGLFLSAIIGLLVSRRLALPLRNLVAATKNISTGDYTTVPVKGDDEVADLARAFNRMANDLKEMHMLEAELQRRERIAALGEISVGIAHEVRNPLGTIKTSAELVRRRGGLGPDDDRLIGYVIDEVDRINSLITDFLDFAKPRSPLKRQIYLSEVAIRVISFFQPEFSRRKIQVNLVDEASEVETWADSDLVFQACMNLILNALDAMSNGGELFILIAKRDNDVIIEIRDTGSGIESDIQEKIFNPFFTTKSKGTGLGLSKVFTIMRGHDGSVECKSVMGQGAKFILKFPVVIGDHP
ncbi:MAG: sensor histidine kinase [Parvibaculaceae bacterium]